MEDNAHVEALVRDKLSAAKIRAIKERRSPWESRFLVALFPSGDLLLCAKHLLSQARLSRQSGNERRSLHSRPTGHPHQRQKPPLPAPHLRG